MPAAVAIPAIIGAVGAGTSVYSAHKQGQLANQQAKLAGQEGQLAQALYQRTIPAYNAASDYYMGILSGDPAKMMAAVGPDVNAAGLQFDQARKNLIGGALTRGGGLATGLSNLEAGRAYTISNILSQARPAAAAQLVNLSNPNGAISAFGGAIGGYGNALNSQIAVAQQQNAQMGQVGSFLARILAGLPASQSSSTVLNLPGSISTGVPNIPSPVYGDGGFGSGPDPNNPYILHYRQG